MSDAFSSNFPGSGLGDFGFDDVQSGETYEIATDPFFGADTKATPTIPEKTVRPFESFRERRDQRLAQLRQLPDEDITAQSCWGGLTNGDIVDEAIDGWGEGGFNTKSPTDDDRPQEDPVSEEWNEVARKSDRVRVESEDDPEVFVMIKVATESTLEIPSLTVSKTSGSGKSKSTTTITIPQRTVRVTWLGQQA